MDLKEAREHARVIRVEADSIMTPYEDEVIVTLDNRITELEECLKWYADERNYILENDEFNDCIMIIYLDGGKKARKLLEDNTGGKI